MWPRWRGDRNSDRTDLAEVLGNLLENAARHATRRIRISVDPGSSIIVEDDGAGIVPAQWPRVLERGVRLDERGEGARLGLAIVQDVLRPMAGGSIWPNPLTLPLWSPQSGSVIGCVRIFLGEFASFYWLGEEKSLDQIKAQASGH